MLRPNMQTTAAGLAPYHAGTARTGNSDIASSQPISDGVLSASSVTAIADSISLSPPRISGAGPGTMTLSSPHTSAGLRRVPFDEAHRLRRYVRRLVSFARLAASNVGILTAQNLPKVRRRCASGSARGGESLASSFLLNSGLESSEQSGTMAASQVPARKTSRSGAIR